MSDNVSVDFWDTMDYLELKYSKKQAKQRSRGHWDRQQEIDAEQKPQKKKRKRRRMARQSRKKNRD